jgi:hypothetical protein
VSSRIKRRGTTRFANDHRRVLQFAFAIRHPVTNGVLMRRVRLTLLPPSTANERLKPLDVRILALATVSYHAVRRRRVRSQYIRYS